MPNPDLSAISHLKREAGLPSSQVNGLAFDARGRLWLTTPSGLACYDGARVSLFAQPDNARSRSVWSITTASNGDLWIGTDAGIEVIRDGAPLASGTSDLEWHHGAVTGIAQSDDLPWLGTASGLFVFNGQRYLRQKPSTLGTASIRAIAAGRDGRIWVAAAGQGVYYRAHGQWTLHDRREWRDLGEVVSLAAGQANDMLIGTETGFIEVSKSGFVRARQDDAKSGQQVRCMAMIGHALWAAIDDELCVYEKVKGDWHLQRVVLERHLVNDIKPDTFGNVWAATEGQGVVKISVLAKAIRRIGLSRDQAVFTVRAAGNEQILVGGEHSSCFFTPDTASPPRDIAILSGQQVWDMLERADGSLIAATANGLAHVSKAGKLRWLGKSNAALQLPNRCVAQHDGRLFVGSVGGCAVVDHDLNVANVPTRGDEPIGYTYTLLPDQQGRLWAGTVSNGLWVYDDHQLQRFEHELLSRYGNTYALDVRSDGQLVIAQDNRILQLGPDDELTLLAETDDPIAGWAIRWAPDGTIWSGSAAGLVQYSPTDGRVLRQIVALLGISNWEFTTSRSLHVYGTDRFYCGVNVGLVEVDTRAIANLPELPEVSIGTLHWERVEPEIHDRHHEVPYARWTLNVEVFAPWFIDEQSLQYRFRITGFDEDWRELQSEAAIQLNTLPPGDYAIEAQAFNRLVGFGPPTELMTLRVKKPGWLRRVLLEPVASLTEIRRINLQGERNRSLNRKNRELQKLVEERTADLELAKKHLEQMNAELANQSVTDALTGVGNRRQFNEQLAAAVLEARRTGKPLSLLLLDVDYFKPYNDIYGHAKGDDCLKQVAAQLGATLFRPDDELSRYGGEEFAVLLPDATTQGAMSVAERLRESIEELGIEHEGQPDTRVVTLSVGATTWNPLESTVAPGTGKQLIEFADAALYEAKQQGRNTCRFRALYDGSTAHNA